MARSFGVLVAMVCLAAPALASPERIATRIWVSPDHDVVVPYSADLAPRHDLGGSYFRQTDWRAFWRGATTDADHTRGANLVSFTFRDDATGVDAAVETSVSIGRSDDVRAVATCLTAGVAHGTRLATRTIHGVRFTAYRNEDAAMSKSESALDLRAVVHGTCYAIDRVTAIFFGNGRPASAAKLVARADALIDGIRLNRGRERSG